MIVFLATLIASAAFAGGKTTSISGQTEVNVLGTLAAEQADLRSELEATRKELADLMEVCRQECPADDDVIAPAPAPKPKAVKAKKPAPKPVPTVVVVPIDPVPPVPVIVPDPKIAAREGKVTALETALVTITATIAAIPAPVASYDDAALVGRVKKLEDTPPAVVTHTVRSYETGAHLIGYAGGGLVIAQPLPGFDRVVRGRADIGARYSWDISKSCVSGIYGEVGLSDGVDVRGLFGVVHENGFGGAVGVGYRCDALGNQGCGAESTGAIIEGTWERPFGKGQAWGMLIRPGVEINYASVPNLSGFETRLAVNFDFYLGRAKAVTITAH